MLNKILLVGLLASFLAACSQEPENEAAQVVRFLRDGSPVAADFEKFPREYWSKQCLEGTQIWKTALQVCSDNGPHNPLCDSLTNMPKCIPK